MSDLPGYDFAVQGLSGLMSITGPAAGPPFKVGVAIADVLTGLNAAVAILACLHARRQSGHGYSIDLALLDCAVAAQVNLVQAFLSSGTVPARQGNAHLQIVPYQTFATADDWIILAIGNDAQWQRFCQIAERPDLAGEPRYASNTLRVQHRTELVTILEALFRNRSSADWQQRLASAEIPHAPVWNYAQLFGHPQATARKLRVTVRDPQGQRIDLVGSPFHIAETTLPEATAPPALGQDTDAVLREVLGLDEARIGDLRRGGVG
jgi:crotonobetainyl-CoA:carnitine CoA-transferase CaiB-like acyl-CoA transferase